MLDSAAAEVLTRFEGMEGKALISLGNHGGFSGASLWRVKTLAGDYCLRAWPPENERKRIVLAHDLLARAERMELDYIPRLLRTRRQSSWVELDNRFWDLTTWMPGKADFHEHPTRGRLQAAMAALARLHLATENRPGRVGPAPCLLRRASRLTDWPQIEGLVLGALRDPSWSPLRDVSRVAAEQVIRWRKPALKQLDGWLAQPFPLQLCLVDVWHDHVLFEEGRVTGIIDHGAARLDHAAVDLARLMGSFLGDDQMQRDQAFDGYEACRPLGSSGRALVDVLDRTGVVVAAIHWLIMLWIDQKRFEDMARVGTRLAAIVGRMASWRSLAGPQG